MRRVGEWKRDEQLAASVVRSQPQCAVQLGDPLLQRQGTPVHGSQLGEIVGALKRKSAPIVDDGEAPALAQVLHLESDNPDKDLSVGKRFALPHARATPARAQAGATTSKPIASAAAESRSS